MLRIDTPALVKADKIRGLTPGTNIKQWAVRTERISALFKRKQGASASADSEVAYAVAGDRCACAMVVG